MYILPSSPALKASFYPFCYEKALKKEHSGLVICKRGDRGAGGEEQAVTKGATCPLHSTEVPAVKNTSKLKHSELFCSIFN